MLEYRKATRGRDSDVPASFLWLFWEGDWRTEVFVAVELLGSSALAVLLWELQWINLLYF